MIKLSLLHKFKKPGPQVAAENTHYGIKLSVPEAVSEHELVRQLVVIPPNVYRLPDDKGAAIDFGSRVCSRELVLHLLQSLVWEKNLHVLAWLSTNSESVKLFKSAGLCITEPPLHDERLRNEIPEADVMTETVIHVPGVNVVYSSMRSGQRIDADGDVLVWGHLNPGAEIKAGGSVIIAGRMLGQSLIRTCWSRLQK